MPFMEVTPPGGEDRLPESALELARAHALQAEVLWDHMLTEHQGGRWPEATQLDIELRFGQLWATVSHSEIQEADREQQRLRFVKLLDELAKLRGAIGRR